jgi:hypothetical protein
MRSTIFSSCPGCRETVRVLAEGSERRCANCQFDFASLADDQPARERWMLENLSRGAMEKFGVLLLYQLIMRVPPAQARNEVFAFAKRHGVEFGASEAARRTLRNIVLAVAIVALAVLVFFLSRGRS